MKIFNRREGVSNEAPDLSNVVPFPRHEIIDGASVNLGRMSLTELVELETQCRKRYEDAAFEYQVVCDERELRELRGEV